MHRWGLSVAAIVLLGAVVAPAHAASSLDPPIQPGSRLTRPDIEPAPSALPYKLYRCTMSFIFRDAAGALYTGTTGESECVGAHAYDENGIPFGTPVFREFAPPAGSFTLIKIDAGRAVDPAVKYWGGPTGIEAVSSASAGDVLLFTGQSFVEGDVAQTQPRPGVLTAYDAAHFSAETLAQLGDSGAPVIKETSGLAVGMISDFGTADMPPATDDGPSILRILADCAAHGFDLTLVTAPYTPPF